MIDAHHHFWRLAAQEQPWRTHDHAALARDFLPEDLRPLLQEAGVAGTVLVQSVDEPAENDRLTAFAAADLVRGVVGWLPLATPDAAEAELDRSRTDHWSGVRCLIGRDDVPWLGQARVRRLLRRLAADGLSWDVVPVTAAQVDAVVDVARALPELRIVVDHLARPPLDGGDRQGWAKRISALAACPNIAIKVSVGIDVLTGWQGWDVHALDAPLRHVLNRFGPERCMLASNWPVITLRADYIRAWQDLDATLTRLGLDATEGAAVRGGTAERWYGLAAVIDDE
ncbi:amidohydrolase family protein [Ruania alba]|nr:amidohydrolase family protein [Ruania alba]